MMEHIWQNTDMCISNCTGNMFSFWNLYRDAIENCRDNGLVIEVGIWTGTSLSCLIVEALNSGKNIRVYGVDAFGGNIHNHKGQCGPWQMDTMTRNLIPIWEYVRLVKAMSVEAAAMFKDADMVFIDADHSYEAVCADLEAWYPVVRKGGIFAGHDIHYVDVRRAVDEFAQRHGLEVEIYPESKTSGYGYCWKVIK